MKQGMKWSLIKWKEIKSIGMRRNRMKWVKWNKIKYNKKYIIE